MVERINIFRTGISILLIHYTKTYNILISLLVMQLQAKHIFSFKSLTFGIGYEQKSTFFLYFPPFSVSHCVKSYYRANVFAILLCAV